MTSHYIDIGQGEPVVMVNGFMLSTYNWRNNAQALLDAGFRVIMVNLPGYGQTDIPDIFITLPPWNLAKNQP